MKFLEINDKEVIEKQKQEVYKLMEEVSNLSKNIATANTSLVINMTTFNGIQYNLKRVMDLMSNACRNVK